MPITANIILISLAFCSLMAASGCSRQHLTNANIDALNANFVRAQKLSDDRREIGVSPKEVESILGQPAKTETFKIPGAPATKSDGLLYIYTQNGQKIVLTFIGGKLTAPAPHFGTELTANRERHNDAAQPAKK